MKLKSILKKILGVAALFLICPVVVGTFAANGQCNPTIEPTFFGGFVEAAKFESLVFLVIAGVVGFVGLMIWCFNDETPW